MERGFPGALDSMPRACEDAYGQEASGERASLHGLQCTQEIARGC